VARERGIYEEGNGAPFPLTSSRGGPAVSIAVDMTPQEIAALKQFKKLEDDGEAVAKGAREFLRIARLRELKAVSGKVEYDLNWQELEERELPECGFPR
jgi:hypothetical protein